MRAVEWGLKVGWGIGVGLSGGEGGRGFAQKRGMRRDWKVEVERVMWFVLFGGEMYGSIELVAGKREDVVDAEAGEVERHGGVRGFEALEMFSLRLGLLRPTYGISGCVKRL